MTPKNIKKTVLRIGCKINLTLRITGVLSNGWHELDTVFLPLDTPSDTLSLTLREGEGFELQCSTPDIDPLKNTLTKAYRLYGEAAGFTPGLTAVLEKGIPHGAGLGGGSADAAALLNWLNQNAPRPLAPEELADLAVRIGADVPFFLYNIPCRATGIGDKLIPCPEWPEKAGVSGTTLLLLCPAEHVSTPWAYAAWDRTNKALTEAWNGAISCPSQNLLDGASSVCWLENSFEPTVFEAFPHLRMLREQLLQSGAFAAVMSGSGSSLFGLFRSRDVALKAAESIRGKDVDVHVHAL